ncbi:MAG: DUF2225 domain-containing protein [Butyrivibrio sp.]|nr:DUF2225 domain-containing protein [Butyrivibrio sp.]
MGFLDGLKKLGLGGFSDEDFYEDPKKKDNRTQQQQQPKPVAYNEVTLLFDKKFTCPVCDKEFTAKKVRGGKVRTRGVDLDLRPDYEEIDQIKYDVVTCSYCGYSALERYWGNLTKFQINEIREKICKNYRRQSFGGETYSYDEAKLRYELAMATAMARKSKNSEKAYLCLRMAWLLRGERQRMDPSAEDYAQKKEESEAEEKELLQRALEGFAMARSSETPPIAGMDEMTLDYLMAAMGVEIGDYETANKMIGTIITSRTASSRIKDKARELKEIIAEKKGSSE